MIGKILMSLLLLVMAGAGLADVNSWGFNFQSELRDKNGNVYLDDRGRPAHRQTIQIRLYGSENAEVGSALWGRQYVVRCDANGYFNVFVSDALGTQLVNATLEAVFAKHVGGGLYVGVKRVGDDAEMKPRTRLCAVPTAAAANIARSLTGTTSKTERHLSVDGKVTVSGSYASRGDITVNGDVTIGGELLRNGAKLITVPVGGIILWPYFDKAPDGKAWSGDKSQDGRWERVVRLKQRFPLGASSGYARGSAGGEADVRLVSKHMPRHYHTMVWDDCYYTATWSTWYRYFKDEISGTGYRETPTDKFIPLYWNADYNNWYDAVNNEIVWGSKKLKWDLKSKDDYDWKPTVSDDPNAKGLAMEGHTSKVGSGSTHSNLPPYVNVCYIKRIL